MTSTEFRILSQMLNELKAEMIAMKQGVDTKIEVVAKTVMDAFQGFGILDPEEDTWTETQVCDRYHVSRRTMYNHRKEGRIAYTRSGSGKNCMIRYRKADIIELFASERA
ncbi:MAG: helix-turn-helix domain-containing protein [Muribaculaceae bacterium]|nr:helix-turn-helix domain-containing protein [Muribaculaceae bacterium]